eukprot:s1_g55.t1
MRAEASNYIQYFRKGRPVKAGRGLSFWFEPTGASISEIPMDDRQLMFLIKGQSNDYQELAVQGVVLWRVSEPVVLGDRVDFTIDVTDGAHLGEPEEQIQSVLTGLVREFSDTYLKQFGVRELLEKGLAPLQMAIKDGFAGSTTAAGMGLEIVSVRVLALTPSSELARALQTPTFEALQQKADEATFNRRALAVEKERAIAENELSNKIELATRRQDLIDREDKNTRAEAEAEAAAMEISVKAKADATIVRAEAEAARIRAVEQAAADMAAARISAFEVVPPAVLYAMAAQEFAGKLDRIDNLTVSPDMLASMVTQVKNLVGTGEATFFLESRDQKIDEIEERDNLERQTINAARTCVPSEWSFVDLLRDDLDRFLFFPNDIVIAVGQDGLVANLAKYLEGQPVVGISPDARRTEGILTPHSVDGLGELLQEIAADNVSLAPRSMVKAQLGGGEELIALNELFVGHRSHQSARYVLNFDGAEEFQSSSGVIVATGTGLTGWAKSVMMATNKFVEISPDESSAVFFAREPWPSQISGCNVNSGKISQTTELHILSRINEGGVIFADGIEQDFLTFDWGVEARIGLAERQLMTVAV